MVKSNKAQVALLGVVVVAGAIFLAMNVSTPDSQNISFDNSTAKVVKPSITDDKELNILETELDEIEREIGDYNLYELEEVSRNLNVSQFNLLN